MNEAVKPLLQIEGLQASYGDVQVLWGVDLTVQAGEIACVVGSNGAGKSTLLRTISGLVSPRAGQIRFADRDLAGASPEQILGAGIAHVPEGRRLFRGLSVRDNLLLGAYLRRDTRADIQRDLIGRGLMSRPTLLMIDELSLGLAPRAVEKLSEALHEINRTGLSILLVEQDVFTAFDLARSGVVIETGRVAFAGDSRTLAEDPRVRTAYMGI